MSGWTRKVTSILLVVTGSILVLGAQAVGAATNSSTPSHSARASSGLRTRHAGAAHSKHSKTTAPKAEGVSAASVTASAVASTRTTPGVVWNPSARNVGTNIASGTTTVNLSWTKPVTGPPVAHYELQVCNVKVSSPAGCGSNDTWTEVGTVAGGTTNQACQQAASWDSAISTCYYRVRAVTAYGVVGKWRRVFLTPSAPYTLVLVRTKTPGQFLIAFRGPADSGPPPRSAKSYVSWVCRTSCASSSSWYQTDLGVPFPPPAIARHVLGTYNCGVGRTCMFRMQFVAGTGRSIATPPVSTNGATISGSPTPPSATAGTPQTPHIAGAVTATEQASTTPSGAAADGTSSASNGTSTLHGTPTAQGTSTANETSSGGSLPLTGLNTTKLMLALLTIAAGVGVVAASDRHRRYRWRRRIRHVLGFR